MSETCPTCGDGFESEVGMKSHHTQEHGESLVRRESGCKHCGDTFEWYPREAAKDEERRTCPECYQKGRRDDGDVHPLRKRVTVKCAWCGESLDLPPNRVEKYNFHFCDENGCLAAWRRENWTGEDAPAWKGGWREYYGSDWVQKRSEIRERDGHECRVCGVTKEEHGRHLDVHHIRPVRTFDDPNEAHSHDNMILLCPGCHKKAEFGKIEVPEP
ncbi:HNH endonuclease [Haloarcula virus HCTV-16]|nr:HNH endonuclease [Haloarcula virus HCTV-16]